MKYNTTEYIKDSFEGIDYIFRFAGFTKRLITRIIHKLLMTKYFDYRQLISNVWNNLPSALIYFYLLIVTFIFVFFYSERGSGFRIIALTTGSMQPSIPIGSLVVSEKTNDYKEGDIVTFFEKNPATGIAYRRTLTHRLVQKSEKEGKVSYITKGDANDVPDPNFLSEDEILGEVVRIFPFIGYYPILVKTPPGFLVFIVIPVTYLILKEIIYLRHSFVAKY